MPISQVEDIRNVALVGHGAVGKTTLADLLLFRAGLAPRAGSVDDGTSLLDADDEEKERKFSISSHLIHFDNGGKWFNLIDTPGYPDFIGQTVGALQGVETAIIVIAADAGIAVNTRKVFDQSAKAGLGRMIVLTKLDHENIDFEQLVENIQESFGQQCLPLNVPAGLANDFKSVVSTLDPAGAQAVADPSQYSQKVLDAVVEADEALMERYFEGEQLSNDEIAGGITRAIANGTLIPIFCVSCKTGVGIPELMDALARYSLPPSAIERHAVDPASGVDVVLRPEVNGPIVAQVFKNRIDPFVSKLSYLRIFSGKLTKDCVVHCPTTGKQLKLHQLFHVQGSHQEPVDEAIAGDIVAVVKMDDLHVGDTVCNGKGDLVLPELKFPTPMIGLAVEPKSRNDQQKISGALHKIEEEDPTFRVTREAQTHEMVMQGMSELHLQIVTNRLHNRDKVDVLTHAPKIPYRETVNGSAEGQYRHKKQSGGSGQFAEVHMRISAVPHGINPAEYFTKERFLNLREYHYDPQLNFAFIDRISGGSIPNQFIPAVEKGVRDRMERGVLAGFQVQDCAVELYFGKDHPVDSNEAAFRMAGSMCFRNLFRDAKPALLEPIMHVDITVPGDKLGDITSDLNSRRGRVEGMDSVAGGYQVISARVPLSEMMTYSRALSSMTGGQGSFTMELSHYDLMPPNEQAKVVAAASGLTKDEDE